MGDDRRERERKEGKGKRGRPLTLIPGAAPDWCRSIRTLRMSNPSKFPFLLLSSLSSFPQLSSHSQLRCGTSNPGQDIIRALLAPPVLPWVWGKATAATLVRLVSFQRMQITNRFFFFGFGTVQSFKLRFRVQVLGVVS